MTLIKALAIATAGFSTTVAAQAERDLGSHEHGSASLNVALDEGSIILELETPWDNLVGFEHQPRTDEQHALVDDALARLNQPGELFLFDGTDCVVTDTVTESSLEAGDHDAHDSDEHHDDEHASDEDHAHDEDHASDEDHAHDDKDHDEEHEGEHASEHHDEHEHDEGTHSSLFVSYTFDCDDVSRLSSIDVQMLTIWSGFENLDVQMIGPGGQAALDLSPQQLRIDVTQVQ